MDSPSFNLQNKIDITMLIRPSIEATAVTSKSKPHTHTHIYMLLNVAKGYEILVICKCEVAIIRQKQFISKAFYSWERMVWFTLNGPTLQQYPTMDADDIDQIKKRTLSN
jgi:hypothetical protein